MIKKRQYYLCTTQNTQKKEENTYCCLGWEGLTTFRYLSTVRRQNTVRAGSAICFIHPLSSQPFIIQNRLSNYQCIFNNKEPACHSSAQPGSVKQKQHGSSGSSAASRHRYAVSLFECTTTLPLTFPPSPPLSPYVCLNHGGSRGQNNWTSCKAHVVPLYNSNVKLQTKVIEKLQSC